MTTKDHDHHAAVDQAAQNMREARIALEALMLAGCPGPHRFMQHRDGKPPWCKSCGRTGNGDRIEDVKGRTA